MAFTLDRGKVDRENTDRNNVAIGANAVIIKMFPTTGCGRGTGKGCFI